MAPRALRLPIVRGRAFTAADREDAPPVAIVNQMLARRLWPGAPPLGARVRWAGIGDDVPWMTVVGIAGDVAGATPASPDAPAVYMPYAQRTEAWQRFGSLVVRTRLDERATVAILRDAVARVDPDVPLAHLGTMTTRRADTIARPRFLGLALGLFALAALILAVQGVYGTVSYVVEQRRREFGVRVAVGATAGDVIRLVLRDAAVLSLAGITLGSIIAALVTRLLGGLLYGVGPNDPLTHVAAAVALAAATLGGAYVPARRAARADPLTSLRQD